MDHHRSGTRLDFTPKMIAISHDCSAPLRCRSIRISAQNVGQRRVHSQRDQVQSPAAQKTGQRIEAVLSTVHFNDDSLTDDGAFFFRLFVFLQKHCNQMQRKRSNHPHTSVDHSFFDMQYRHNIVAYLVVQRPVARGHISTWSSHCPPRSCKLPVEQKGGLRRALAETVTAQGCRKISVQLQKETPSPQI